MRTSRQTFYMYGYLITAIVAIVSTFLPLYSLSLSSEYANSYALDPADVEVTARAIMTAYGWVVVGAGAVGAFFVLARYRRIPVFVLGIITTAALALNAVMTMVSEDAVYGRFSFIPGMPDLSKMIDITLGAGYYIGAVAAFLMLFFTFATFLSVREQY